MVFWERFWSEDENVKFPGVLPIDWYPVELPSEGEVPYSNHAEVNDPFGFTVPFMVAKVWPMPPAEFVVTMGAPAPPPDDQVVGVKERMLPCEVPKLFCATTRKK